MAKLPKTLSASIKAPKVGYQNPSSSYYNALAVRIEAVEAKTVTLHREFLAAYTSVKGCLAMMSVCE